MTNPALTVILDDDTPVIAAAMIAALAGYSLNHDAIAGKIILQPRNDNRRVSNAPALPCTHDKRNRDQC